jgi:hypothetical protein
MAKRQAKVTRDWIMGSDGRVKCFDSLNDKCEILAPLIAPLRATPAHNAVLMRCTKEINAILRKARKSNSQKGTDLHLLRTPRGLLLAWASCDGVCSGDDPAAIDKAFGIK